MSPLGSCGSSNTLASSMATSTGGLQQAVTRQNEKTTEAAGNLACVGERGSPSSGHPFFWCRPPVFGHEDLCQDGFHQLTGARLVLGGEVEELPACPPQHRAAVPNQQHQTPCRAPACCTWLRGVLMGKTSRKVRGCSMVVTICKRSVGPQLSRRGVRASARGVGGLGRARLAFSKRLALMLQKVWSQ
jgi:hypothetical protein